MVRESLCSGRDFGVFMSSDEFYASMQKFMQRRPFVPFVVELKDGRRLVIKKPKVAFNDEGAGFIDPEDGALVDFLHDEVQGMELWKRRPLRDK
jgi:hypothetical protein